MNTDKLDEHLAVKVMGLKVLSKGVLAGQEDKYKLPNGCIILATDWQPHKKTEQAMMVLDTFEQWTINTNRKAPAPKYMYVISIVTSLGSKYWEGSESLPLAICIAAAKATGYSDE